MREKNYTGRPVRGADGDDCEWWREAVLKQVENVPSGKLWLIHHVAEPGVFVLQL